MEKTVQVKSTERKEGSRGEYLSVVWSDGYSSTVFDPDQITIIDNAYNNGSTLHITQEKKGKFWNLTNVELADEETPKKKTWKPKDQDAEDWTNIRTAVMQAVALRVHLVPGAKTDVKAVMQDAAEIFAGMCMLKPSREQ